MLRRTSPSPRLLGCRPEVQASPIKTWFALLLGLMFCASSLTSCVAPGSSSSSSSSSRLSARDGTPSRVTFVDYRTNVRMNLVNEAHTDPVKYYSEKKAIANTKVTSNEVMAKMLEHFHDEGYSRYAVPGYAPVQSNGDPLQSIEIETPEGTSFMVNGEGVQDLARKSFRKCRKAFMQIQELTIQAQAVDNSSGRAVFENPSSKN